MRLPRCSLPDTGLGSHWQSDADLADFLACILVPAEPLEPARSSPADLCCCKVGAWSGGARIEALCALEHGPVASLGPAAPQTSRLHPPRPEVSSTPRSEMSSDLREKCQMGLSSAPYLRHRTENEQTLIMWARAAASRELTLTLRHAGGTRGVHGNHSSDGACLLLANTSDLRD